MGTGARQHNPRGTRRGFSIVELLVVVAVTGVGFVALLDLQVSSIRGLTYPANLTAAINLGEHFLSTLRVEAIEWTGKNGQTWDNPRLKYLSTLDPTLPADSPDSWQVLPAVDGATDAFRDQAGADDVYDPGLLREIQPRQNPRFCLHYQLVFVSEAENLIRAQVRVLWLRDEASWAEFKDCPLTMAEARFMGRVQSVTLTDQILINTSI